MLSALADYRCSLLVVDDEPYVRSTLTACLQGEFEVLAASSGDEALRLLQEREIDVILSDQRMQGMSGVELLDWVRQNRPKTIRILMTGFAELEDAVQAINRGQVLRFLLKPWRLNELQETMREAARACRLERSHDLLLQEVRRLNTELELRVRQKTVELEEANRQLHQRNLMLERLALTDELTGLPNRRAIDQILQSEVRRRSRYPSTLAVGLIDADHFKEINTRHLYPGGDQVLASLATVLSTSIRGMDTVGRIGGEEFVVIAPITDQDGARGLGERIRQAVSHHAVRYQGNDIRVTVSVGVAVEVGVELGVGVTLGVRLTVSVGVIDAVAVGVGVAVVVAVSVAVRDRVGDGVGDAVGVELGVGEAVGVAVRDGDEVGTGVAVPEGDNVAVGVGSSSERQPVSLRAATARERPAPKMRNGSMSSSGLSVVSKCDTEEPGRRRSGEYMRTCVPTRPWLKEPLWAATAGPTQWRWVVLVAEAARWASVISGHRRAV